MALSADKQLAMMFPNIGYVVPAKAAGADTFYKGAIVCTVGASGYVVVAADTATYVPLGLVKEKVTATAAGDDLEVIVGTVVWIPFTSAAQADVGDLVYPTADDTIAKTASNVTPLGLCVAYKSGYLLVDTRIRATS